MGTALRSISLRIRGYSESSEDGFEELDDELQNISGDLINLTKTAQHSQGISVFKPGSTTEFKSLVDYLGEVADIWDEMTDKQQNDFLQKAFAKTQAQAGAAIIRNFDQVRNALQEMEESAGSADREMSIVEQSIDFKLNALQQTWVHTIQELGDRKDFGAIIEFLTRLSESLGNLLSNVHSLPALAAGIGSVVHTFKEIKSPDKDVSFNIFGGDIPGFISKAIESFNELRGVNLMPGTKLKDFSTGFGEQFLEAFHIPVNREEIEEIVPPLEQIQELLDALKDNEAEDLDFGNIAETFEVDAEALKEFVEENDLAEVSAEDLQGALTQEAEATEGATRATGAFAAGQKAAAVATGILKAALSAAAWYLVAQGITMIVQGIDAMIRADEIAIEKMKETQKEISDINNTLKENNKFVSDNIDRYLELADGVDRFTNANKNLSAEEYEEFLEVNNKFVEMFPELLGGFDDQGNAIANLGDNADESREKLKQLLDQQIQNANYEKFQKANDLEKGTDISIRNAEDAREELDRKNKEYQDYLKYSEEILKHVNDINYAASDTGIDDFAKDRADQAFISAYQEIYSKYGGIETNKNINSYRQIFENAENEDLIADYKNTLNSKFSEITTTYYNEISNLERELNNANSQFLIDWNIYTKTLADGMTSQGSFAYLSKYGEKVQEFAYNLFANVTPDMYSAYKENKEGATFFKDYLENKYLVPLTSFLKSSKEKANEANDLLSEIYSFDLNNSSASEYKDLVGKFIKLIKQNVENGDKIPFSSIFKLDEKDAIMNRLKSQLKEDFAIESTTGDYNFDYDKGTTGDYNFDEYNKAIEYTKDFTYEQLESWNEITKGITNATDKIKAYEATLAKASTYELEPFAQEGFEKNISDLKTLQSVYEKFAENVKSKKEDFSIDISDVASLRGAKDDDFSWVNVLGEKAFNEFEQIVTSADSTQAEIQAAFDKMATGYISNMVEMQGASDKTFSMIETQLKKAGITNVDKLIENYQILQDYADLKINAEENLKNEYQKISEWGLDDYAEQIKNKTIQTKFGNVDMDKRTIITWSQELKDTFKEELASWEYDPEIGDIDTVFGGSSSFRIDGQEIEIAYTPIMVDENGNNPQFLDEKTVSSYIQEVLNQADKDISNSGDEWSLDLVIARAMEIDAEGIPEIDEAGREVGRVFGRGLIAQIGDNEDFKAEVVGSLMHFAGEGGAIQIAERNIQELEAAEEALNAQGKNLQNITDADIASMRAMGIISAETAQQLYLYATEKKIAAGQPIDSSGSVSALYTLALACGVAKNELKELQSIMGLYSQADSLLAKGAYQAAEAVRKAADARLRQDSTQEYINGITSKIKGAVLGTKSSGGSGGGGGGGGKDEAEETKDIMAELSSQLDEIQSKWESLTEILDHYNETGKVTIDQAQELFQTDWKYLALLGDGTGIIQNADEAFQSLAEAKINEMRIQLARNALEAINGLTDEAKAAEYLANAYHELAGQALDANEALLQTALITARSKGGSIAAAAEMIYKGYQNAKALTANIDYSKKDKDSDKDKNDSELDKNKDANSKDKDKKENNYTKELNWIEKLLEKLNKTTEKWQKRADKFFSYWNKNWAINKQLNANRAEIDAQKRAYEYYKEQANSVKLNKKWKDKVDNGEILYETITNENVGKKIEEYEKWREEMKKCKDSLDELYLAEQEMIKQKLDNIVEYFDTIDDYYNSILSKIDSRISAKNAWGNKTTIEDIAEQLGQIFINAENKDDELFVFQTGIENPDNARAVSDIQEDIDSLYSSVFDTANYKELLSKIDKLESKKKLNKNQEKQLNQLRKTKEALDNGILSNDTQSYMNVYQDWYKLNEKLNAGKKLSANDQIKLRDLSKQKAELESHFSDKLKTYTDELRNSKILSGDLPNDTEQALNDAIEASNNLFEEQLEDTVNSYQNTPEYQKRYKKYLNSKDKNRTRYERLFQMLEEGATDENISEYLEAAEFILDNQAKYEAGKLKGTKADKYDEYLAKIKDFNSEKAAEIESITISMTDAEKSLRISSGKTAEEIQADINSYNEKIAETFKSMLDTEIASLQSVIDALNSSISETENTITSLVDVGLNRINKYNLFDLFDLDSADSFENNFIENINDVLINSYKKINKSKELAKLYETLLTSAENGSWKTVVDSFRGRISDDVLDKLRESIEANIEAGNDWTKEFEDGLVEVRNEVIETTKSVSEFLEKLRENVVFKAVNNAITQLQTLRDLTSSTVGLIKDDWLLDVNGITEFGLTKISLLVQEMKNAQSEAIQYDTKINGILNNQKAYDSDEERENDLIETRKNLLEAQSTIRSIQDELYNIGRDIAQQEIDNIKSLIDKYKEALNAKKSYYDYDKNIKSQTKNIEALRSQIEALNGVTDAASKARVKQLQDQIKEAEENLEDTKIQHEFEMQIQVLDDLVARLEEALDTNAMTIADRFEEYAQKLQATIDLGKNVEEESTLNKIYNLLMTTDFSPEVNVEAPEINVESPEVNVEIDTQEITNRLIRLQDKMSLAYNKFLSTGNPIYLAEFNKLSDEYNRLFSKAGIPIVDVVDNIKDSTSEIKDKPLSESGVVRIFVDPNSIDKASMNVENLEVVDEYGNIYKQKEEVYDPFANKTNPGSTSIDKQVQDWGDERPSESEELVLGAGLEEDFTGYQTATLENLESIGYDLNIAKALIENSQSSLSNISSNIKDFMPIHKDSTDYTKKMLDSVTAIRNNFDIKLSDLKSSIEAIKLDITIPVSNSASKSEIRSALYEDLKLAGLTSQVTYK